jgi:hypothetical protein
VAWPLIGFAVSHGINLPIHDVAADYVAGFWWSAVLGMSILLWPIPVPHRATLFGLWIVKAAVALGFMLIYESSYSSLDAFRYFLASLQDQYDWSRIGFGNGTENMEALAWLHGRFLPHSYHALKTTFAMIGLIAGYLFFRAAVAAGAKSGIKLLVLLVLTPSILFWSSIVGKDPLILLGVAVYSYGTVRWVRGRNASWLILALSGALLASSFRIWLGPILTVPVVVLTLVEPRRGIARLILVSLGIGVLFLGTSVLREKFFHESTVDLIEATNSYSQAWAQGGSAQVISTPFTGVVSVLRFLPLGMFTALLRPLPGEVNNPFGLLAGLENLALLILAFAAILRSRLADLREPLVIWAITLLVCWSTVYGFLSYQNLGSGVRFRLQILPIFFLLLLHLARRRTHPRSGEAIHAPLLSPQNPLGES